MFSTKEILCPWCCGHPVDSSQCFITDHRRVGSISQVVLALMMASWQTCLTMRAKQSCWAAGRAQYFIRLQSLNRQLSSDHVIRPHQRDSIDSCSFKLASVLDDWVQPVHKPEPFTGGLTFHYRRIFYDNQSMVWSGQQVNGWRISSTLSWSKLPVHCDSLTMICCLFLSALFFWLKVGNLALIPVSL